MEVKDMRRFINPTILCLCLVALVAGAATETSIDYAQVAEDIDVMAKIIDKTLEEKFHDEYKASRVFLPFGESRGCHGIYLKGYGAIFVTSISFPVAEQEPPEDKVTPDDLWQRTRYELRGVSSTGGSYFGWSSGGEDYHSEKVQQLKEELLRLVGTYAPNIRQLGAQENVVIAVRGTPGLIQISTKVKIPPIPEPEIEKLKEEVERLKKEAEKLKGQEMKEEAEKLQKEAEKLQGELQSVPQPVPVVPQPRSAMAATTGEAGSGVTVYAEKGGGSYGAATGVPFVAVSKDAHKHVIAISDSSAKSRTTLIIKASRESIMSYKDGGLDFDAFMKQAEITQY
jgi:hypothetical protein